MRFTKMHGIGNDYIYIDCFEETQDHDWNRLAQKISDRHFGVGSDGLILVMPSDKADFRMRMFNADGSEGDMCGNGIRCFAKLVHDKAYAKRDAFTVETRAGIMRPELLLKNGVVKSVRVNMGPPSVKAAEVPMDAGGKEDAIEVRLRAAGADFVLTGVRMGNPNGVVFVDDVRAVDLERFGPALECHPVFSAKANIEFARVVDDANIEMVVWERGSGVTLACGTGACAALVAANVTGRASRAATVVLPGGKLAIEWASDNDVYMTGPAETICTGEFCLWP